MIKGGKGLIAVASGWLFMIIIVMVAIDLNPKKPQVQIGSEKTIIKVVIHDTIQTVKTVSAIQIVYKRDTVRVKDSVVSVKDSVSCYQFDQKEPDGAKITAQICSDSLPKRKPLDLTAYLNYVPAPDTIKTINRIDTLIKIQETPITKDFRYWLLLSATVALAGYTIGNHFLK